LTRVANELGEKMKPLLPSILCLLLLVACDEQPHQQMVYYDQGPVFSAGAASRSIQEFMGEQDAIRAIGREPDSVNMETCGQQVKPWTCKTMRYRDSPRGSGPSGQYQVLLILLAYDKTKSEWFVNS
jgi:hypothetical protein